mmetsp:Transcript_4470/g.5186  ORF Transcript_4470/g.5186 Transcript_4470/m.5186 type:complete len:245 (+) Transcript_4470:178-912(+)|eukprot:CAMPEP_0184013598 /NCGR_PEP_ID=MMETSP0954-20121128/5112_1 /TAXON_ID=627963 /ORGANISM="Aplanochytrium sp, Strain PBS07" /LENGTH=244 /DNA_ID=CAMNT_0026293825 /DNA_START=207 /DNA_END=941 /DNA_ORIENTATION=-
MATEECIEQNNCESTIEEDIVQEVLTAEQALTLVFVVIVSVSIVAFLYHKYNERRRKQESLGLKYNFALPKEVCQYAELLKKEPEEGSAAYPDWHKNASTTLFRRAVMDLMIYPQILKDHQRHERLYKTGIVLDLHEDIKRAKMLIEKEIAMVQQEAELLNPGWGRVIFAQARKRKEQLDVMRAKQEAEKAKLMALKAEKKLKEEQKRKEILEKEKEAKRREKLAQELIAEEEKEKARKGKKKN